ncbi:hypothetical protein CHS0354_002779 [Potamilus streckersoni]|uniref:Poly(A) RNA polymerase GLD2 n=1 Tax=Potamilus streckersoni TaxID=2493646 RepID=A0AAE0SPD3_9BIVA|nr:hypothetical protein CHS0354_002779 [Potamilus streckersoni]
MIPVLSALINNRRLLQWVVTALRHDLLIQKLNSATALISALVSMWSRYPFHYSYQSTMNPTYSSIHFPERRSYYPRTPTWIFDPREAIRQDILRTLHHPQAETISPVNGFEQPSSSVLNAKRKRRGGNSPSPAKRSRPNDTVTTPDQAGTNSESQTETRLLGPGTSTYFPENLSKERDPRNEQISGAIWTYYLAHKQTLKNYEAKVYLRDALFSVFKGVFPYCGLYIVGSSMTGFSTIKSDVDLCLMVSPQDIDQKKEATVILNIIQQALRKCNFVKRSLVIRAKVPILKFWEVKTEFECDLNINNAVGIRNTHLLRYYCSLDWRVGPLVLYVKYWARYHDINDASKSTVSSYSLCLMVIHYLQAVANPPVVPCLQKMFPRLFCPSIPLKDLKMNLNVSFASENTESLGDLFLGFLKYYACDFNFLTQVISVRLGKTMPISYILRNSNPGQWKCLCIEEPFDLSNTARSCYDDKTFSRVTRVIRRSHNVLARTRDVSKIFSEPF